MSNKIIFIFMGFCLLLESCVSSKIPKGWLPEENEGFAYNAFGAYLYLEMKASKKEVSRNDSIISFNSIQDIKDTLFRPISVSGEYLGLNNDTVFLISHSNIIYKIVADRIDYAQLDYGDRNTGALAGLGILGILLTISNGGFLIITAPLNIAAMAVGLAGESDRDLFYKEYPRKNWFGGLERFARFPQGITKNIELTKLKSTSQIHYLKTLFRQDKH